MKRRWEGFMMMLVAAVLCFSGCGSDGSNAETASQKSAAQEYATDDIYVQEGYAAEATDAGGEAAEAVDHPEAVGDKRKLIKNVSMSVETEEFDTLIAKLESKIEASGGYIENMMYNGSSLYGNSDRTAGMTIRIPKDRLDGFVTEVSAISNVVSRNESTTDVTMQYVDLESHKKALWIEQERLMELLGQAETMDAIIALEKRLSEVRYELESMESQLRTYDNLVDYSTVQLDIMEVVKLTPVREKSAMDRMADGFAGSLENLISGLKNFFITLVILLPYIIFIVFWTLVILALIFGIRKIKKKNTLKKSKQQIQPPKDNVPEADK